MSELEAKAIGPDTSNPVGLVAQLYGNRSPKLRRALAGYAVATSAFQLARKGRTWWQGRYAYTVSVRSSDDVYDDVHELLLAMIPEKDRRAVIAGGVRGHRRGELLISPDGGEPVRNRLVTFYDGDTSQTLTLDGHKIAVSVEKEPINFDDARTGGESFYRFERLKFVASSAAGRAAVLAWLGEIVESRNEQERPRFFIMSRWGGGWDRRNDLEPRALESVVLRAGQIEALTADIETFLSWRDAYMRYGIPYHRGYLFHGPPGTGKTSLARALAQHFGLDVYYAPLSDLDKDTNLLHLVSSVKAGSVLLLEDIDVLHAATHRDDDKGISLSGLLNALDGVSTPSGIITIMTTNHPDVLDDALIRPGRVDRSEPIGFMDDDQLARLIALLCPEWHYTLPSCADRNVTPAEVLEVMKRQLHEPREGVKQVCKMLRQRTLVSA